MTLFKISEVSASSLGEREVKSLPSWSTYYPLGLGSLFRDASMRIGFQEPSLFDLLLCSMPPLLKKVRIEMRYASIHTGMPSPLNFRASSGNPVQTVTTLNVFGSWLSTRSWPAISRTRISRHCVISNRWDEAFESEADSGA
jgi:hypothetical protein